MPTDAELWRTAAAVANTMGQLVDSGKMAQRMFDDERLDAFNAQTVGDDATLMRHLNYYDPNDLQAYSYSGLEFRTTVHP